jgi:hypothetical protein
MTQINICYSLQDFIKYKEKEINSHIPANIKPFCNEIGGTLIFRESILKDASTIISNFMSGKNPNNIVFKNKIIELLNKINQKNFNDVLSELQQLNYSNIEHFSTLAQDLLFRSMTDSVAVKGIDLPADQKSLSELYSDIIVAFSQLMLIDNNKEVKFNVLFLDYCQKYFVDFTNKIKPLDQNNQYRVDNYKGFCNLLGLLFQRKIVSQKIITGCLSSIRDLIFTSGWGQLECENVYDGYKKVLYKILSSQDKSLCDNKFIENVIKIHNDLKDQNEKTNKLRKFTMMVHKDIDAKLQKLIS